MSKAPTDLLAQIHAILAQAMLDKLESGEAEAKDWAVIVKFLKDNNIDAAPSDDDAQADSFAALVARAQESISRTQ